MPITYGSICSGIEATTAAWHPLGMHAMWYSEIEPFLYVSPPIIGAGSLLWNQRSSTSLSWPSCWGVLNRLFAAPGKLARIGCHLFSSKEIVSAGGLRPCANFCRSARKGTTLQSGRAASARHRRSCPRLANQACRPMRQGTGAYSV